MIKSKTGKLSSTSVKLVVDEERGAKPRGYSCFRRGGSKFRT